MHFLKTAADERHKSSMMTFMVALYSDKKKLIPTRVIGQQGCSWPNYLLPILQDIFLFKALVPEG